MYFPDGTWLYKSKFWCTDKSFIYFLKQLRSSYRKQHSRKWIRNKCNEHVFDIDPYRCSNSECISLLCFKKCSTVSTLKDFEDLLWIIWITEIFLCVVKFSTNFLATYICHLLGFKCLKFIENTVCGTILFASRVGLVFFSTSLWQYGPHFHFAEESRELHKATNISCDSVLFCFHNFIYFFTVFVYETQYASYLNFREIQKLHRTRNISYVVVLFAPIILCNFSMFFCDVVRFTRRLLQMETFPLTHCLLAQICFVLLCDIIFFHLDFTKGSCSE